MFEAGLLAAAAKGCDADISACCSHVYDEDEELQVLQVHAATLPADLAHADLSGCAAVQAMQR